MGRIHVVVSGEVSGRDEMCWKFRNRMFGPDSVPVESPRGACRGTRGSCVQWLFISGSRSEEVEILTGMPFTKLSMA